MVPHTGLVGILNESKSSFMEIMDAKCARIHMPTKPVGEYEVIDQVKSNLFTVCLTRREDMGPQALAQGSYQNLARYHIRVTRHVYELEGTLEWTGRFDFACVMVDGFREFVPL